MTEKRPRKQHEKISEILKKTAEKTAEKTPEIIISDRNHSTSWTISHLVYSQVEFFFIGITKPVDGKEFLLSDFILSSPHDFWRWSYDVQLSAEEGFLKDYSEDLLSSALEGAINEVAGMVNRRAPLREIEALPLPPSYKSLAEGFCIGEDLDKLEKDLQNLWDQGYNTITIHNHPAIPLRHLDQEIQEGLEISYDLFRPEIAFDAFVDEQLRPARLAPSQDDLETTRRLSNIGAGIIVVGRNMAGHGSYRGRIIDFTLHDLVGFKADAEGYEPMPIRGCSSEENEKIDQLLRSYYNTGETD